MRSGHTEAGTDLAALAGLPPVGLLAELVNDNGTVQRLPELVEFAAIHKLKIITIADLIAYRQQREKLVERSYEFAVKTSLGDARHSHRTGLKMRSMLLWYSAILRQWNQYRCGCIVRS